MEVIICMKMSFALNNLYSFICLKTQTTNQPTNLKSKNFSEKIKKCFGEIDPKHRRFWLSTESSKAYMQKKNLKQHYCL